MVHHKPILAMKIFIIWCLLIIPIGIAKQLLLNSSSLHQRKKVFGDVPRTKRGILIEEGDPLPVWELGNTGKKPPEIKVACSPLPPTLLKRLLGSAFNPRYMSVDRPLEETTDTLKGADGLKHGPKDQPMRRPYQTNKIEAFHVYSGFTRILHDEPLDYPRREIRRQKKKFRRHSGKYKSRSSSDKFLGRIRARRNVFSGFPWTCSSRVEWVDLGPNHFPRYLRTVTCTSAKCWFGHFECRAKAFTVKVLRRRKDSCTPSLTMETWEGSIRVSDDGEDITGDTSDEDMEDIDHRLPQEFREEWVFEERAVTFCCECST